MAFGTQNKRKVTSEINVTPLVDVVFVLLAVFMITMPMLLNGISLNLPKTKEVHRIQLAQNQIILSMTKSGEYYLGKNKVLFGELVDEIVAKQKENGETTVFLRADYGLHYGKVAVLMGHLKKAGITQLALVTENEKQ